LSPYRSAPPTTPTRPRDETASRVFRLFGYLMVVVAVVSAGLIVDSVVRGVYLVTALHAGVLVVAVLYVRVFFLASRVLLEED
jgi:hypothetical protein